MQKIPNFLIPYFRTNHAGETGAVFIYKGILYLSNNKDIVKFSNEHLQTEQGHLRKIEKILPKANYSKLLFLWKILGFLTGFIPVVLGKKFVYATIFSVESFVELHYQEQINLISKDKSLKYYQRLIKKLMHDEIEHKDQALNKIGKLNFFHNIWGAVVRLGSIAAVKVSKKL